MSCHQLRHQPILLNPGRPSPTRRCTRNYDYGTTITPTTDTVIRYGEGFASSQKIAGGEKVGWRGLGSTDIGLYRVAQDRNGEEDAAASLREGLEETLTVWKLDLPTPLRRFFATTNAIENVLGVVRRVSRNVKVPASLPWIEDSGWIEGGKKMGFDVLLESKLLHDAFPEIRKSKTSYVPYVAGIYYREKTAELPFGVTLDMDAAGLEKRLGAPAGYRPKSKAPWWRISIDPKIALGFDASEGGDFALTINGALELASPTHPSRPVVGLFVAWAIQRGLFNSARFPGHVDLLARIKARKALGSELVASALPRGLWTDHLVDKPELRLFAYSWFNHLDEGFIRDDLVAVFGSREDEYGHDEPVLDEDTWKAVDRASRRLDKVFAAWL